MSNAFHFDGYLATDPHVSPGDIEACRLQLIRVEQAGRVDGTAPPRERQVAVNFVAFGARAESLRLTARKGDFLGVIARIENTLHKDAAGNEYPGYQFVIRGFEYGVRCPLYLAAHEPHPDLSTGA
jgi:hypothetical protein